MEDSDIKDLIVLRGKHCPLLKVRMNWEFFYEQRPLVAGIYTATGWLQGPNETISVKIFCQQ